MIKKLTRSIREYKKECLLTPVFVVLEVVMEIFIPLLIAAMIDNGITGSDADVLHRYGTILIICVLIGITAGVLAGSFCANASAGFAQNLRQDMYDTIQNYSFANIDKFSSSSIVTRLTTDVTNVQNAFMMIIRVAVRAPFILILSLLAAFTVSAKLSLIYLVAIPVLGAGLWIIVHYSHPWFEHVFHIYDELNNDVQEDLIGIRVVKSFVREGFEEKKFGSISNRIYKAFRKAESIVAWNMPLMQFVVYACILLISWFGAQIIVNTHEVALTTGELSSMIAYAMSILNSLMMLSMVMVMLNMARASAERIVEVLDESSTLQNPENAITEVKDGEIVFEHVGFSYKNRKDKECLHDISLEIPSGRTLGIIGATGSGKSSLVQLIPRLYDVTEGCVKVGGVDVRNYDLNTLRSQVAMVLQKNKLFSGTIKENLRWGDPGAGDDEIIHACKLAQADPFIQTFPDGYDTYIEQGGTNVSGGQKQRLCIARALLKKPKILILDDSTSAVDTKTDMLIRTALRKGIPSTTKIIIAQRISSVQDADMILVLNDGTINGYGTHDELLKTNAIYQEIYISQTKGEDQNEA